MAQNFQSLFVSNTEKFICSLGNTCAQTFLSTGVLGNGFAVLSDKRVYFKGTCFIREGKRFSKRLEERIVDVKDVTGTGFIHKNPVWALIVAIICCVLVFFAILSALSSVSMTVSSNNLQNRFSYRDNKLSISDVLPFFMPVIFFAVLTTVFLLIYRSQKRSLFEIQFAGGGIAFDTHWFKADESQKFQNCIRIAKDNVEIERENRQQQLHSITAPPPQPANGNIADELKKYSDLLAAGAISQGEYEAVKMELLKKV
ncbi:MAG: SHOCT domain-containing protein [Oscillospiraceae bacterium]|nr:SHOCT domain-containing protein [Oscillospiraceae bacterium]